MALFKNKKKTQNNNIEQLKILNLEKQNRMMETVLKMGDKIEAQMGAFKSFPEEFYPSGIKQGKYAGVQFSNNSQSRRLSRITYDQSPVAGSVVNTISTLAVGRGLDLESNPLWLLLNNEVSKWKDEQKSQWMRTTEARYKMWAKRKSSSYNQEMNRYQQEQYIFERLLIDGEYFEIYRYSTNSKRNPLTIQLILPEDVRTPTGSTVAQGNFEENGIEYNSKGQAVAYHIYNYSSQKTVRVLKVGTRSGRVFVNHVKLGGNRRGIGIIFNMITELMKLGDYEVLELQAAVVNALYAVWMKTPDGEEGVPTINGGIGSEGQQSATQVSAEDWLNDRKEVNYNQGGLQIDALPGGYELQSHDTKRPNVNFGAFSDQVKKNLAASKNIPISVLDKQFQNSYSASRGELILAWYEIQKYRFNQSMTNDLVYKMWIWGEVANGNIDAPGFFESEDNKDAWSNAKWIGNERPDIDPLRSVKAHVVEQNRAYKTGKQITAERGGGDYDENLIRVNSELEQVAVNQKVFKDDDVNLTDQ